MNTKYKYINTHQLQQILESDDFDWFITIKGCDNQKLYLKNLINKYQPNWLNEKEHIKALIKHNSYFINLIENELIKDINLWMELFNKYDKEAIKKFYQPDFKFNFQLLNDEQISIALNKCDIYKWFFNINLLNLNKVIYQSMENIDIIINYLSYDGVYKVNDDMIEIIKQAPIDLLNDQTFFDKYCEIIINNIYQKETLNIINEDLIFNNNQAITCLLKNKYIDFNDYYDKLINQPDTITYLLKHGYFNFINKLKDEDFIKIKPLIVKEMRRQYKRNG